MQDLHKASQQARSRAVDLILFLQYVVQALCFFSAVIAVHVVTQNSKGGVDMQHMRDLSFAGGAI